MYEYVPSFHLNIFSVVYFFFEWIKKCSLKLCNRVPGSYIILYMHIIHICTFEKMEIKYSPECEFKLRHEVHNENSSKNICRTVNSFIWMKFIHQIFYNIAYEFFCMFYTFLYFETNVSLLLSISIEIKLCRLTSREMRWKSSRVNTENFCENSSLSLFLYEFSRHFPWDFHGMHCCK